jgi:predicted nuclease with TOPRIM domain
VEKEGLNTEKTQMITQLENLQKEYDKLSEENTGLNEMFEKEKAHVEDLLKKVRNSQGNVEKYKAQVAALESRLKEYEQQIEQLKNDNKELVAENFVIKTSLDSTVTVSQNLKSENTNLTEQVNKGSVLTVYDLSAGGIKITNSMKEVPTVKSKRADKIRVCFTLGENAIAAAGKRDVFVRIADPSGNIFCKGKGDDYSFTYQDKSLQYSVKQNVNYNNKATDLCLYWDKDKDFVPGNYIVDIFVDGNNIGTTNFAFEK